jgi:hypothetical protein
MPIRIAALAVLVVAAPAAAAPDPTCAVQILVAAPAAPPPTALDDEPPPAVTATAPVATSRSTQVALVAARTASHLDGGGVRVGVEVPAGPVLHVGAAVQALALTGSTYYMGHDHYDAIDEQGRHGLDLLATLRLTGALGRLRLHPQVAVGGGVARHRLDVWLDEQPYASTSTSIGVRAAAALTLSVPIGARWRAELGAAAGLATYWDVHRLTRETPIRLDSVNTIAIGLRLEP